jgi:uncharacterized coiled-coil DUF342 family protein
MTWLLVLAIGAGVAAVVVTLAAAHSTLQAQRQYERLLEQVPKAAHLADLEQRIADRRTEVEKLSGQVAEHERLRQLIPGLERAVADLEKKKATLAPVEELYARLGEQVQQRQRELEALAHEADRQKKDLGDERERLEGLRRQADTERIAATTAKAEVEQARQQLVGLQASIGEGRKELDVLGAKVDSARDELRVLLDQQERQQGKLRELKAEKTQLDSEIVPLRETKAALQREIKALGAELDRAREHKHELAEQIAGLLAQKAQLEESIKELERRRKELEGETNKLLAGFIEHGKAMTGGFDFVDAFEAVREPVLATTSKTRDKLDEARGLEEVKQHAKDLGFVYSDRVIRSFHTSLKLGGQSPLLVLAGISGTGKSQLPRIYCDALGINFLSMAVQPGWDSPADLLGFFSHIERRFKPTPLARALLQMDPHAMEALQRLDSHDKARGKAFRDGIEPHHDEMLMVLLDEMNLARIEYYFSDFLSKLETRNSRGFKESDAVSRARAEVLLEAPNARGGLQALPLFAGKNVLFVGTMNEDESTMALSDKVIDRANVLRFGRPAKLETKPGSAKDARVERLGKGVWSSWCNSTTALETREAEVKRIRAWIDLINEGMDKAHRPFAYRTDQAIQAYCLGYPKDSLTADVALRMAFADQIEQRIMPKLRGLDLQEDGGRAAIGAVQQVVSELKDDELAEAIELGKRANGGSSFAWYGVTRSEKAVAAAR